MSESPKPPVARKERTVNNIHGKTLSDDYAWLRNKESEEVINYLNEENAFTEEIMRNTKDGQERLFKEIKGRIKETDETVPYKYGDYYYYTRTEEGKQYTIRCRKYQSLDAEEEIFLNENTLAEGKEYFRLVAIELSPNHKKVGYVFDDTGYEKFKLNILNLETREVTDTIIDVSWGLRWIDDSTILYSINDKIHRPYAIKKHTLGSTEEDQLIYEDLDEQRFVGMSKSMDGKYIFIQSESITSSETLYLDLESPNTDLVVFKERAQDYEYNIEHHEGSFYITTNEDAINFRIFKTPVTKIGRENWEEYIPHDEAAKIMGLVPFKRYLLVIKRVEGLICVDVKDLENKANDHEIKLPEPIYSLTHTPRVNRTYDSDTYRFSYSSLTTPNSVYDYNFNKKELVLLKMDEIKGHNSEDYEARKIYATAEDGEKVPISVVSKKGVKNAPTVLYGYGSYGYTIDAGFSPSVISLLDRGMIYAIGHIRGSQYKGRKWYEDGKMMKKKNTFTDFIACGEYLISTGLANKEKLAIMGGSAGGLLMGACVNMRPDLFKVVLALVPFVDVMNTMLDSSIPLTTHEYVEWGNPNELEAYAYMLSYSPYDNVEAKDYPHILITAGLNDPRVHYWEPAKWTAKLRDMKTDSNLLLLKTNMGAGHGGASGRYDYIKEIAFRYAFLFDRLDIEF